MVGDRAGGLVVVVVLAIVAGGSAAGGAVPAADLAAGEPGAASSAIVSLQAAPEADNTITRITVHENGSASWQLRIRTRLESDGEADEYRAFQERFRENTSRYLGTFQESITGIVANAREVTGREMRAEGFAASTTVQTVPRRWGVVTYEFRWVGFAAVDGDRLRVGDVFEGGLFIADGDVLEIAGPPEYSIESVEPGPDESADGVVSWRGREDFGDGRPQVVFAAAEDTSDAVSAPLSPLLGGGVVLAIAVLAVFGYRRWGSRLGAGATTGDGPGAAGPDGPTLADEDHVRRLLADNDGRVRQKEIAESLDWSRSKTSRVLARMEEDGAIEKLRLGRENVIALPDDE